MASMNTIELLLVPVCTAYIQHCFAGGREKVSLFWNATQPHLEGQHILIRRECIKDIITQDQYRQR